MKSREIFQSIAEVRREMQRLLRASSSHAKLGSLTEEHRQLVRAYRRALASEHDAYAHRLLVLRYAVESSIRAPFVETTDLN